jgi:hypothetical protein
MQMKKEFIFSPKSKIKIKIDGQTENKLFISEHRIHTKTKSSFTKAMTT